MFDSVFRFLFGDDIFISYSRSDGDTYAAGLANQLISRRFSCKLDQWVSQPGREIPPALTTALRRSSILVLVGSPGAARSVAVAQEIREFRKTNRPIIPIDFNGAITTAEWFSLIEGLHLSPQNASTLTTGDPTDEVLNRIDKSYTFSRKDQRLRAATLAATIVLALLTIAGVIASVFAEEARREASQQRLEVSRQSILAKTAKEDADRQQAEADHQRKLADAATRDASAQQRIAAEQKEVAIARQLLARAQLARNQGGDTAFVLPVKLALEAWEHYPSREVEEILRHELNRLPKLVADFTHAKPVSAVAFSANGTFVTTRDRTARLWHVGSSEPIRTFSYGGTDGPVAVSPDGAMVAVGDSGSVRVYRLSASEALQIGHIEHNGRIEAISFTADAKRFAVGSSDLTVTVWDISANGITRVSGMSEALEIKPKTVSTLLRGSPSVETVVV